MRPRRLTTLAALSCLLTTAAAAQNFSGSYTMNLPNGGVITITLRQDATGHATGTMAGNGSTINLDARLKNSNLVGRATSAQGALYFMAALEGEAIEVVIADMAANGQPNFQNAKQLMFQRQGDAPASAAAAPTAPAAGNPLARSKAAPAADPWLGTFLNEQIAFTLIPGQAGAYGGNMVIGGQDYPFTARKAAGKVSGSFNSGGQAYTFEASLAGNTLSLASGGQTYTLQRRNSATAAAPGAAPAPASGNAPMPQNTDQVSQQLTQLLTSSSWCSFSYNATTGYSSKSQNTFRPDGILVIGTGGEGGTMNQQGGTTVAGGSFYSQRQGGGQAQWRVQGGQLYIDAGQGAGWQVLPLNVTLNSAGNPIIKANGTEYMRCN
jgi:hypothetical protein